MKRIDWQKIKSSALSTIRSFPVELIIALCYFVVVVVDGEIRDWHVDELEQMRAFIPLFWVLSFAFNRLFSMPGKRWIYYLSILFVLFAPFVTMESWSNTYGMTWLMALALVLFSCLQKDNRLFTIQSVRIPFHLARAGLLALALSSLLGGIYYSVIYIFDLHFDKEDKIAYYLFLFPLTVIGPFLFCLFQQMEDDEYTWNSGRFFKILNNWILSPALIVYTLILYAYGLKVLFEWSLPEGMLSYMISIFLCIAVVAKACQDLLDKKHYAWYFQRFSLIALPILLLFWIGIIYRIREYGLTEGRIFLTLLAALLTIITLMDFFASRFRYLYFCCFTILLLGPVTLIPGMHAEKLGLLAQEKKLNRLIDALDLRDLATGLIRQDNISTSLLDSISVDLYRSMKNTFTYVAVCTNQKYMEQNYGYRSAYDMEVGLFAGHLPDYLKSEMVRSIYHHRSGGNSNIPINGYNYLFDSYFRTNIDSDILVVKQDDEVFTTFPIGDFLEKRPALYNAEANQKDVNKFLYVKNDSCMAILEYIGVYNGELRNIEIKYILKK